MESPMPSLPALVGEKRFAHILQPLLAESPARDPILKVSAKFLDTSKVRSAAMRFFPGVA